MNNIRVGDYIVTQYGNVGKVIFIYYTIKNNTKIADGLVFICKHSIIKFNEHYKKYFIERADCNEGYDIINNIEQYYGHPFYFIAGERILSLSNKDMFIISA